MSAARQETPQLQYALHYARLGWSVVPSHKAFPLPDGTRSCTCSQGAACVSKGKHPAVPWTEFQSRRAHEDQIRDWFAGRYAEYGVGIITGKISGFFVVDIDCGPGKAGAETIDNLQFVNDDLPQTVEARTGGGGRHILLKHPGDGTWIATTKNILGPGVDIRGDGGFIVAAPSMHESGAYYLWHENGHPKNTAIADAPAWVVDMASGTAPSQSDGTPRAASTGTGEIIRDAWGRVTDGRERHMIGIICGVIATLARKTGSLPDAEAVFADTWPSYERTTKARGESLEADGRGETLMRQRIPHFLRRASSDKWKLQVQPDPEPSTEWIDPETGEVFPEKPAHVEASAAPETKKRIERPKILSLSELDDLPPPEWVVKDLIPEAGFVVPYGPPKSGKTFIMLSAGLHVADGRDWFGTPVKQGAVIYIAGEGTGGLSLRLKAMRQHYGISASIPFWVIPRAINFQSINEVEKLAALIKETAGDMPVRMVFLDTLARAMPGVDENSVKEVGLVIAACDWLRDELGATILPIHHSGKDSERGARGTSALRGAWDAAFEINGKGKAVTMKVADQKEGESGNTLTFDMVDVMVGLRTTLVPVLRPQTDSPDNPDISNVRSDVRLEPSGLTGMAYRALSNLLAGPEGALLPPLGDLPSETRGVRVEAWRKSFYAMMPTRSQEARQKSFVRAADTLQQQNVVGLRDPYAWLVRG